MSLGERLLELRKSKYLSQEEIAEKLNVTRQTISKWETNQSTPDFDKIIPICELFGITTDELLTGVKKEKVTMISNNNLKERAKGIGIAVFLYFVAIAWIMVSVTTIMMDPVLASAIFLLIIGAATYLIIYTCTVYKKDKQEEKEENVVYKRMDKVIAIIFLIIYLLISFITMAWHITWILWIVYALVINIVKLIMTLKDDKNEK